MRKDTGQEVCGNFLPGVLFVESLLFWHASRTPGMCEKQC